MKKNIENNIRFNAVLLYIIAIAGIVAMIFYINDLRKDVRLQKSNIEEQHQVLSLANELVYAVNEAQSRSGKFLISKNRRDLKNYELAIGNIDSLVTSIIVLRPEEELNLRRIENLLEKQTDNIVNLSKQLKLKNPVREVSQKIKVYENPLKNDTVIVTVKNDTLIKELPQKGFMKRLGEVFRPSKDSAQILVTQRYDTVRDEQLKDTLEVIYDVVENAAKDAENAYRQNIINIEKQLNKLVQSDKTISSEISAILLQFHKQTLESTQKIIVENEASIEKNYTYSMIGGCAALFLILIFIILIINNVNKGLRARRQLEHANAVIKSTMESRHNLLLSVSHDIKSPLNSITGYLDFMPDSEEFSSMKNSASHILSLLDNLLDFSTLEQGKMNKSEVCFSLNKLSTEIYDMFTPLAKKKLLSFDFESSDIMIETDRTKLKQLIINLVSNAIKYTTEGDIFFETMIVDDETKSNSKMLKIIVEDTGAGIPEDKIKELFKPFSRIEENNKLAQGTGLGLFVVKGIVELLEGEISYSSEQGLGTKAEVCIPVKVVETIKEKKTLKVKLYDDDDVVLRVVSEMVMRLGHIITDEDPELIITDMEMGDITGLDILANAGDTPVIVMTGRSDYSHEKALADGFKDYMPKPVNLEILKSKIGEGESFEDMLGSDFNDIVDIFKSSVVKDMNLLRKALNDDNYHDARSLCHKMRPMFIQLGYPADALTRMDINKTQSYESWKDDVNAILSIEI